MPTDAFNNFAKHCASIVGSPWAFVLAVVIVMTWVVTGPHFAYSDTWQLVINTGTTIVTFLMVFLIQNTQNRDAKVVHLKLDELIHGVQGARNSLIDLENLSDRELEVLQRQFERLRKRGDRQLPTGQTQ
jgi:low affinity Fe/Cu permease